MVRVKSKVRESHPTAIRFLLDEHWPCYSDPQWDPHGTRVCDKNHGRMHRTVYDAGGPAACRGTASAWGVQDTMLNHGLQLLLLVSDHFTT